MAEGTRPVDVGLGLDGLGLLASWSWSKERHRASVKDDAEETGRAVVCANRTSRRNSRRDVGLAPGRARSHQRAVLCSTVRRTTSANVLLVLGRPKLGSRRREVHARCSPERFARCSSFNFSVEPMSCIQGGPWIAWIAIQSAPSGMSKFSTPNQG